MINLSFIDKNVIMIKLVNWISSTVIKKIDE